MSLYIWIDQLAPLVCRRSWYNTGKQGQSMATPEKIVKWIASTRKDLRSLPKPVREAIGYALWEAQIGKLPLGAKVLHGFAGASVVEIRAAHEGNAYRAVYTVRFGEFVYILHVFQKKSKKGTKTPPEVVGVIRGRLKAAEEQYEQWKATQESRD
jgi:phage-related protein